MKKYLLILAAGIFLALSCNKNKNKTEPEPEPVVVTPPVGVTCQNLPDAPEPFGWLDTTFNEDRNVNAFFYNPADINVVVYVANGNIFGFNKMYSIDLRTKNIMYLATLGLGNFLPSINYQGRITFSTDENNIFTIKANGDSLKQLTNNKLGQDPKWDYSGKNIYYFQKAYNIVTNKLLKTGANGGNISDINTELPYSVSFKKSDKVLLLRTKGTTVSVILKDMVKYDETTLITGPYSKSERIYFDNMTLDHNDQNFYFCNKTGIFKCNIATLKVDTFLKNCPNIIYDHPIISTKPNEITFSKHVMTPLNSNELLHEYKAMEMDLQTGETSEVKMFP